MPKATVEWSVELDLRHRAEIEQLKDRVGDLVEAMPNRAAVPAFDREVLSVRFCVTADSATSAIVLGERALSASLRKARIPFQAGIIRAEVETMAALEKRLEEPSSADLVGVTEIARILGVTRQRASKIGQSRGFPTPYAVLATGPVWMKASLGHFLEHWPRKGGRPRRSANAAA